MTGSISKIDAKDVERALMERCFSDAWIDKLILFFGEDRVRATRGQNAKAIEWYLLTQAPESPILRPTLQELGVEFNKHLYAKLVQAALDAWLDGNP